MIVLVLDEMDWGASLHNDRTSCYEAVEMTIISFVIKQVLYVYKITADFRFFHAATPLKMFLSRNHGLGTFLLTIWSIQYGVRSASTTTTIIPTYTALCNHSEESRGFPEEGRYGILPSSSETAPCSLIYPILPYDDADLGLLSFLFLMQTHCERPILGLSITAQPRPNPRQ
jgi:hypothetical protein